MICAWEPVVVVGKRVVVPVVASPAGEPHGIRGAVHEVGAAAAMDMQIDEPRRDEASTCIDRTNPLA